MVEPDPQQLLAFLVAHQFVDDAQRSAIDDDYHDRESLVDFLVREEYLARAQVEDALSRFNVEKWVAKARRHGWMATAPPPANPIQAKVHRNAIAREFVGMWHCSPPAIQSIVQRLADQHGVDAEDLKPWVAQVLREMPPMDPEDY